MLSSLGCRGYLHGATGWGKASWSREQCFLQEVLWVSSCKCHWSHSHMVSPNCREDRERGPGIQKSSHVPRKNKQFSSTANQSLPGGKESGGNAKKRRSYSRIHQKAERNEEKTKTRTTQSNDRTQWFVEAPHEAPSHEWQQVRWIFWRTADHLKIDSDTWQLRTAGLRRWIDKWCLKTLEISPHDSQLS